MEEKADWSVHVPNNEWLCNHELITRREKTQGSTRHLEFPFTKFTLFSYKENWFPFLLYDKNCELFYASLKLKMVWLEMKWVRLAICVALLERKLFISCENSAVYKCFLRLVSSSDQILFLHKEQNKINHA
jgi:hypothetical protein